MRTLLAALALALLAAAPASAADPLTAVASIDRAKITVGDPIVLSVAVEAASGYRITDPGVARVVGELEVLEVLAAQQSRLANGGTRLVFRYRVTSYRVGDLAVPPIEIGADGPDGAKVTVRTAELPLQVESVILPEEDASDIKPLKPQLVIGTSFAAELQRWAPFIAAAAVLLVAALVFLLRRRRKAAAEDGRTAAERALAEIERISALGLPEKGRVAEHYELLGAALRRFVADKYGLPARERTARELRAEMERAGIDPQQRSTIFEVLSEGDVARFSGERPYPAHAKLAITSCLAVMKRAAIDERLTLSEVAAE